MNQAEQKIIEYTKPSPRQTNLLYLIYKNIIPDECPQPTLIDVRSTEFVVRKKNPWRLVTVPGIYANCFGISSSDICQKCPLKNC